MSEWTVLDTSHPWACLPLPRNGDASRAGSISSAIRSAGLAAVKNWPWHWTRPGGRCLEIDADGQAIVRVVDRADGQTVAILTPEELRSLAEQTGLPSGLLFQARS
jgi:hypothetical protein